MSKDYIPSSPRFLRLVTRSLVSCVAALALVAAFVPAPLGSAADPSHAPNPAKSAWFLLWIQELVSHSTLWMYPVLGLAIALVGLPWLRRTRAQDATWFPAGERTVAIVTIALAIGVIVLTLVAYVLRGERWQLIVHF